MRIGPKTWLLANAKTVTRDDVVANPGGVAWLKMVSFERDAIPIFTTEENANEYIQASNETGTVAVACAPNLVALAGLLEKFLECGYAEAVVIDPAKKVASGLTQQLDEFLTDLRNNMKPP